MPHLGTIVMGTVTAGLLSFALWDTLRDTSEPPSCALQHPEIAMIEELRAAKQVKLPQLYGRVAGSPGHYLDGITLETPLDTAVADRLPTITRPTAEAPFQVTFSEEAGILRAVEVVVGRFDASYDEMCEASDDPCACDFAVDDLPVCESIETGLIAAWGPPTITEGTAKTWTDAETHARARLDRCVLTFDRAS